MDDERAGGAGADGDLVGRRVGNIRVVGRLGEGGWGTVYEGVDEALERRVALKVIHPERLYGKARARLRREARILSRLDDPQICRIHELASDGDRDVLVLEKVDGETLQEVLRGAGGRLDARLRLRIARQVAGVLVRTHAAGIVHRDLKPANVMLTPAGDVKVLDFGIALVDEAVGDEAADDALSGHASDDPPRTLIETRRGKVVGTAGYMSPEQARGERSSPASDMYAFGLLLQELFSGRPPHPPGLTVQQLLARAVVAESEPVAGVAPDLTRLIERLKSADPAARPTAEAARHALDRHAEAPRRRLRAAAALLAGLLVVVAGVGHSLRLQRERDAAVAARERAEEARLQAETARREADGARAEAEEVAGFLERLFRVSDPDESRGRTITADELLRRGAERIDRDLAAQPLVQARMSLTVGRVYRELGAWDEAERFLSRALELRRRHAGPGDAAVAEALVALGVLHDMRGRRDEAEASVREALAIQERVFGREHPVVARSLNVLGEVARHRGDWAAAEALFQRVLAIEEKGGVRPEELARTLNNLCGVYWETERAALAEPLMQRVLTIEEEQFGADHPRVARTLNNLGLLELEREALAEAEVSFRRALAIKERALGPDHPEVASTVFNLGDARLRLGDPAAALALYQRALALDEKAAGREHPNVAFTLAGLGAAYTALGRWGEADAAYRRSLAIFDAARLDGHPMRARAAAGWEAMRQAQAAAAGR